MYSEKRRKTADFAARGLALLVHKLDKDGHDLGTVGIASFAAAVAVIDPEPQLDRERRASFLPPVSSNAGNAIGVHPFTISSTSSSGSVDQSSDKTTRGLESTVLPCSGLNSSRAGLAPFTLFPV